MNKQRKPEQLDNLLQLIRDCVDKGNYILTEHALLRLKERDISLIDAEWVLKNGYHEKRKTSFDEKFKTWKYAIRGTTIEALDIRLILAFNQEGMVIITIMHVGEEL